MYDGSTWPPGSQMGEPHAPERRIVDFGVTPRTLAILPLKPLVAAIVTRRSSLA